MLIFLLIAFAAFGADDGLPQQATAILAKNCYSCHGSAAMAGLRLDQQGKGVAEGVLVPGKEEESRLWLMMNGKGRAMMPPTGKLKESELAVIRDWIRGGARWPEADGAAKVEAPKWWSFQKVKPVSPPVVSS